MLPMSAGIAARKIGNSLPVSGGYNKGTNVIIRLMEEADLQQAAKVHQQAFVRQQRSYEWIKCNFNAAPRFLNFVVELNW